MTLPTKTTIARETSNVVQRAVYSACELDNFPLRMSDVQCAFDTWADELHTRPGYSLPRHAEYVCALEREVLNNLFSLGFKF